MKKYFLILLCSLGTWRSLYAQSLDSLLEECLSQNRMLAAMDLNVQAAAQIPEQVNQLPDPELGINAFVSPVETRLGPQQLRLGLTQMLPWKGTLDAREELAAFPSLLAVNQQEQMKLDLAFRLKMLYLNLYRSRKAVAIAKNQLDRLQTLRSLALTRLKNSSGNLAGVTRIDLKIRELEWKTDQWQLEEQQYLSGLNQLLNRSGTTAIATPDTLLPASLPEVSTDKTFLHPDLQATQIQQRQQEAAIALVALERKPTIGVGMDYIFVGSRTDMDPVRNGRDIVSPRVNIKIPLYGSVFDAKIAERQLRREALAYTGEDVRNKLREATEQSLLQWKATLTEAVWLTSHQEGLDQLIRLKTTDWENDRGTLDELFNLYVERETYAWQLLSAVVRSHLAKAAWEKAEGRIN